MNIIDTVSRREFLKTGAALSAVAAVAPATGVFAAGADKFRIALIGCGSRGTGAAKDCLQSDPGIELFAMADLFQDRLDSSIADIRKDFADRAKAKPETMFLGFDAYKKVLAMSEVDVVLLATPPAFRPEMAQAAVDAGKHIFMEKPGAVDAVGVRSLINTAKAAERKKLSIVVGTQQRYQPQYREIIRRVHSGELGRVVGGSAYWNWGQTDWHFHQRQPEWSDMEWQIRCWPYFRWLSGDHIVEQHLHNMDILNWAIGSHPVSCMGFGGRQVRTSPAYGNIFDHFVVEFEYAGDIRVLSMSSQIKGSNSRVGERVVCAKGSTWTTRQEGYIEGEKPYRYEGQPPSGWVEEHAALIRSIRDGHPINEAERLAESTATVILGRIAAYTGRQIKWDWLIEQSQEDLRPAQYELGPLPVAPVAVPGQTLPV